MPAVVVILAAPNADGHTYRAIGFRQNKKSLALVSNVCGETVPLYSVSVRKGNPFVVVT